MIQQAIQRSAGLPLSPWSGWVELSSSVIEGGAISWISAGQALQLHPGPRVGQPPSWAQKAGLSGGHEDRAWSQRGFALLSDLLETQYPFLLSNFSHLEWEYLSIGCPTYCYFGSR